MEILSFSLPGGFCFDDCLEFGEAVVLGHDIVPDDQGVAPIVGRIEFVAVGHTARGFEIHRSPQADNPVEHKYFRLHQASQRFTWLVAWEAIDVVFIVHQRRRAGLPEKTVSVSGDLGIDREIKPKNLETDCSPGLVR